MEASLNLASLLPQFCGFSCVTSNQLKDIEKDTFAFWELLSGWFWPLKINSLSSTILVYCHNEAHSSKKPFYLKFGGQGFIDPPTLLQPLSLVVSFTAWHVAEKLTVIKLFLFYTLPACLFVFIEFFMREEQLKCCYNLIPLHNSSEVWFRQLARNAIYGIVTLLTICHLNAF